MILEHMRSATRSLLGNKLRTFLSMIGIVIGVASVVAITALGESASASITKQISQAGLETITIAAGRNAGAAVDRIFKDELALELKTFDGVSDAAPVNRTNATLKAGTESASEQITSAVPGFVDIFSLELEAGRFIDETDIEDRSAVVVLGTELAATLFPDGDALGSSVRVLGESPRQLRVIGVLKERSDSFGFSFDSGAFVPRSAYLVRIARPSRPDSFVIHADASKRDVVETAKEIQAWFDVKTGTANAVRVISPSTIAETMTGVTDTLSGFLVGIAAISLLVGGIGIMNIMLVSVTERTREIGVRKALGATPAAIRIQFLVEAIYITLAGGLVGLALGAGISKVVTGLLKWDFILSPAPMAIAVIFSAATGIFFGLYPAARAARLDPVAALSYE